MDTLPCQGCRGMCCGPVPVTDKELKDIRRHLKAMPRKLRQALEEQRRFPGTCIFYDGDADKCGIHAARPSICRAFGHFGNLVCFRKPEAASEGKWTAKDLPVATLSVDLGWRDFK